MNQSILVLIKGNPLESHRPAEAIRIALGLASSDHDVTIVLLNQAPLLLSDDTEDLVDGEILQKYLPTFKELDQTFFVEEKALRKYPIDGSGYAIQGLSYAQISERVKQAGCFFIF